jgi:putative ABC transport system ATP-binding protein
MRDSRIIDAAGLRRTFAADPPVHALLGVTLEINHGEFVALTGRSGSGKSTLLALLGLLDRADAGELSVNGHDIGRLSERQATRLRAEAIGFVFQAFHLLPQRTALENVTLALLYRDGSRRDKAIRAAEVLRQVGLGHRLEALPRTLSGGEQQRVAIARAVVTAPALVLADEPTGNLDSTTASSILDTLEELNARGQTILVATHDQRVAERAGRVLQMNDGVLAGGKA